MSSRLISQLAHIELLTPDIDGSARFFTNFVGLTESARDGSSVQLRAWGETFHHSLELTAAREPGLGHVAWRANSEQSLEAAAEVLKSAGAGERWIEEGVGHGRAYQFRTPSGHLGEIFWEVEHYVPPEGDSKFRNRPQRRPNASTPARFLHHVNLNSQDVSRDRGLFSDLLGFKCNELIRVPNVELEIFAAMACTSLDHDLGLTRVPEGRQLNHLAYAMESRDEVLLAADAAVESGLTIELGPTKHAVAESFFMYVREPASNQLVEIYSGGYLNFEPDRPTVVWSIAEKPHPLLAWGGELPATFGGGRMAEMARAFAGRGPAPAGTQPAAEG